jgi:hypothetical protein
MQPESLKSIGPSSIENETSENVDGTTSNGSTLFAEEIRVRKTHELGKPITQNTRVSAVSSSELLMSCARSLFSGRIHQPGKTLPGLGNDFDTNLSRLVTLCCPSDFEHVALGLTTKEKGCFCLPHWRTPLASDAKNRGDKNAEATKRRIANRKTITLSMQVEGPLDPVFVEELMGFPLGWTDLEDSETQSFHK